MARHRDSVSVNPKPNGVREPPGVASHPEPRGVPSLVRAPAGPSVSVELRLELAPHEHPMLRALIGCGL